MIIDWDDMKVPAYKAYQNPEQTEEQREEHMRNLVQKEASRLLEDAEGIGELLGEVFFDPNAERALYSLLASIATAPDRELVSSELHNFLHFHAQRVADINVDRQQ
jgi:hypothetical protein